MGHKQHRVGRLYPSFLRRVSVPCEGNRKGRKAYCGLVRMWSSLWLKGDGGIRKTFFNDKEGFCPPLTGGAEGGGCKDH